MKPLETIYKKWFERLLFILISFVAFQSSIIPVSASPIIFGQDHHTGISEAHTYDEIENSVCIEVGLTDGLSRVLSGKGVGLDHEVLAEELSSCR
jgi:hypothetical protein